LGVLYIDITFHGGLEFMVGVIAHNPN